jgi:hypothetical protein
MFAVESAVTSRDALPLSAAKVRTEEFVMFVVQISSMSSPNVIDRTVRLNPISLLVARVTLLKTRSAVLLKVGVVSQFVDVGAQLPVRGSAPVQVNVAA